MGWKSAYNIDIASQFTGILFIELCLCEKCHLEYFLPDTSEGSAALYEALQNFDWYYQPSKWEYEVALNDLRGCRKALEVGCGSGNFMALAQKDGPIEIDGLERNTKAMGEAERRGLSVCGKTVAEVAGTFPGKYDAVCSFQVLEHVASPGNFLSACCTLLHPGGKLMLGLPNADSFLRHQFNLLDMAPHHMSRWSVSVLLELPRLFPLRAARLQREPLAEYHVEAYVDAYCGILARGPLARLNHPGLKNRLSRLVRRCSLHRRLRGQTVYVCYERI